MQPLDCSTVMLEGRMESLCCGRGTLLSSQKLNFSLGCTLKQILCEVARLNLLCNQKNILIGSSTNGEVCGSIVLYLILQERNIVVLFLKCHRQGERHLGVFTHWPTWSTKKRNRQKIKYMQFPWIKYNLLHIPVRYASVLRHLVWALCIESLNCVFIPQNALDISSKLDLNLQNGMIWL